MSVLAVAPRQASVLPHKAAAPKAESKAVPQSADQATLSSGRGDDVSWADAGVGLVGAAAGAVIETVGNTVGAIGHTAVGTVEAYRSLYKTEAIGPWLKASIGFLIPVASVAVPILTAIGSAGVGLYRGFTEGVRNGLGAAVEGSLKDVKSFNQELAPEARKGIREIADAKPEDGQEPFDISPVKGVSGAVAGLGNAVVGAVGIGLSTASQVPEAFVTANRVIAKSSFSDPLKAVSHAVTLPLAVLAAPLGVAGGALFGLGAGAYHGYKDGFVPAFSKTAGYVQDYHKFVDKGLAEAAEGLARG